LKKNSKRAEENETDNDLADSHNITENEKYIKKLLVQRSVLSKLTGRIKADSLNKESEEASNTESNQSQTNK